MSVDKSFNYQLPEFGQLHPFFKPYLPLAVLSWGQQYITTKKAAYAAFFSIGGLVNHTLSQIIKTLDKTIGQGAAPGG